MKNLLPLILSLLLLFAVSGADAQTTKTVGATGSDFTTLKAAFDEINANTGGSYTGTITLQIQDNTTETATATIKAANSWTGTNWTGDWKLINIYPTVTGKTIGGSINGPLLNFDQAGSNGTSKVVIDGCLNATGSVQDLSIINTNIGASASAIKFINAASNNDVKYCNIKGSSAGTGSGIIFFSTGGNINNTIKNNNITHAGADADRPINAIYSLGDNINYNRNNVSNNNIYDFFKHGNASYGVNISSYNTEWTIKDNSFYETTSFIPTNSGAYNVINVNISQVADRFFIGGNYIGGTAAQCAGSKWTKTNANNNVFNGININIFVGNDIDVQGNVIQNIDWNNSGNANWTGINLAGGAYLYIGDEVGNTVGSATGTGSISITAGANGANVYGINIATTNTIYCSLNTIASITTNNLSANSTNFYGINKTATAGNTTINGNVIGSTTANSINALSTSTGAAQNVYGIYIAGTGAIKITNNTILNMTNATANTTVGTSGVINGITSVGVSFGDNISNNVIRDLTIANANTSATNTASVCGIAISGSPWKNTNITGNKIYNLSNTYDSFAGNIIGIYSSAYQGNIYNNFVHSLSVTGASSTNASIYAMKLTNTYVNCFNNVINIGGNTQTNIYGIYENSDSGYIYYNTIYIHGSPTTGALNSYAYYRSVNNWPAIKNNIFVNARSNNGATGKHYAIRLLSTSGLTINNNDYIASGTGGVLGMIAAADKSTLALWQTATSQDGLSLNTDPGFTLAGSTNPMDYYTANYATLLADPGVVTGTIVSDYASVKRNTTTPTMGALDQMFIANVDIYQAGALVGSYSTLKKVFDAVNSGEITGTIDIKINNSIMETEEPVLYQSGYTGAGGISNYSSINIYPTSSDLTITATINSDPTFGAPIDFNGADNITFDGRKDGLPQATGKYLTIINSSVYSPALMFQNSATNNTVKYCNIIGNNFSTAVGGGYGVVSFYTSALEPGNDNNTIEYCDISATLVGSALPKWLIYSRGSIDNNKTIVNDNISIKNNVIGHYTGGSMEADNGAIYVHWYSNALTIKDNIIYNDVIGLQTQYQIGITVLNGYGHLIEGNSIGGNAKDGSGTWALESEGFIGISLYGDSNGGFKGGIVKNNTIANITSSDGTYSAAGFVFGIEDKSEVDTESLLIESNSIYNLTTFKRGSVNEGAIRAIIIGKGYNKTVKNNIIHDLNAVNTGNFENYVAGIIVRSHSGTNSANFKVQNNKIYNLFNASTHANSQIIGVSAGLGVDGNKFGNPIPLISHNMISLINNNQAKTSGIMTNAATDIYNNSIYIAGTGPASHVGSYCLNINEAITAGSSSTDFFRNNLFINAKTGVGNSAVVRKTNSFATSSITSNYNLLISSNNIARVNNINYNTFTGWKALQTGIDANSWSVAHTTGVSSATQLNPTDLFTDYANGDLHIKNANVACWFVNGKSIAYPNTSRDFDNDLIKTTLGYGVDTGADEFNPLVDPHILTVSSNPFVFTFAGRQLCTITYSSNPATNYTLQYFTGESVVLPTPASAKFFDCYWRLTPTGGTGTFEISLNYDDALLGQLVGIEGNTIMAKRTWPPSAWTSFRTDDATHPSTVNTGTNILTCGGFTDPADPDYTGTDQTNPLPIELMEFDAKKITDKDVRISWATASEENNDYFVIEKSTDGINFITLSIVDGAGNSNKILNYQITDRNAFANSNVVYYRLKQVDIGGEKYEYSNIIGVISNGVKGNEIFKVYPNPAAENIFVELNKSSDIEITNLLGNVVYKTEVKPGKTEKIDVSKFCKGMYFVKAINLNKVIKIVVK